MIHSQRYIFWKNWGEKDVNKEQWNNYLAPYEYNDETKDCICGYLHGVSSHSSEWMIARFKEIIKKNIDCIRFINVNNFEELNDIIEFIDNNEVDLNGKLHSFHLLNKFISNKKDVSGSFSEKCSLFFINLLPDLFKNFPQSLSHYYTALDVFAYLIPLSLNSVGIKNAVDNTYRILREIRRNSIYLEERRFINGFCEIIEEKFSELRDQVLQEIAVFEKTFFQIDLNWFLLSYKKEIDSFKNQFPNTHKIFLEELTNKDEFHHIPLYLFFFERVFFLPIFSHLTAIKSSKISLHVKHLQMLENFLGLIFQILSVNDGQVLNRKFKGLLESFKARNISTTADLSWGLYGEIRCFNELSTVSFKSKDLIEIPDELKNNDGKVCDVRVFSAILSSYQIYECKCKIPGYGYDGLESFSNDYLINYIPLFSHFITTCIPAFETIKYFPNFAFSNEQSYGNLAEYSSLMVKKGFSINYTDKELRKTVNEQKILKDIIYCFYEEDFHISPGSLLPPEQVMIALKKQQAKLLLQKGFLKNTITNAINKFLDEEKRLNKSNSSIEKFVLCWILTIPQDLIDSPFFEINNSSDLLKDNIKAQIQEILNQVLALDDFKALKNHIVELMFL